MKKIKENLKFLIREFKDSGNKYSSSHIDDLGYYEYFNELNIDNIIIFLKKIIENISTENKKTFFIVLDFYIDEITKELIIKKPVFNKKLIGMSNTPPEIKLISRESLGEDYFIYGKKVETYSTPYEFDFGLKYNYEFTYYCKKMTDDKLYYRVLSLFIL